MPNRRRGDHEPSFADMVAAERARPASDPGDGRSRNRVTAGELWDEEGHRWTMLGEIAPEEAERLIADAAVRLGLSWPGERRLEWFSGAARDQAWQRRFRPRLQEFAAGVPADGDVGYVPQLWARFDGSRLLLLQVLC
jgi:hypothetical protein